MQSVRPILLPFPDQLVGPRVLLRGYIESDTEALRALICEARPHLQRWLPGLQQPPSSEDTLVTIRQSHARWVLREAFQMAIVNRQAGALLGELRLRATDWSIPAFDIAYWLHPAAEGYGFVAEAVR